MDHTSHAVLGQADVDHATNEIARFRPVLERLDLSATVITADALHTQREHADRLVTHKHADYLLLVKANQPNLHCQLQRLPWPHIPSPAWTSPTPPRRCGSPAGSARSTSRAGGPRRSTRSPTSPPPSHPYGC